jgi:hypothetical protein
MGKSHCESCAEGNPRWMKAGKLLNRAVQIIIVAIILFAAYRQFFK